MDLVFLSSERDQSGFPEGAESKVAPFKEAKPEREEFWPKFIYIGTSKKEERHGISE
jgi:hypothetical protein